MEQKSSCSKGISETKSKQQSPCSNCMHWACDVMVQYMQYVHAWPVTSQADACTYCMGSKVSSLSQIYLYSSYFDGTAHFLFVS